MVKTKRSHDGFTLVEVVVVGVIAAILGAIFIPFLGVHNAAVNEGVAQSRLHYQANLVSDELGRRIRSANKVLSTGEAWSPSLNLAESDASEIRLFNSTGVLVRAYSISGGILTESADGASFSVLRAGDDTVRVASGSAFRLSSDRTRAALLLQYTLQYRTKQYQTMVLGNLYACRN